MEYLRKMQVSSFEQLKFPPLLNLNTLLCCPSGDDSETPQMGYTDAGKRSTKKVGHRVLMVGLVRELALYQAEVLRHCGYQVAAPETIEDAIRVDCAYKGCGGVILCRAFEMSPTRPRSRTSYCPRSSPLNPHSK
jgi:hypothetical protein